MNRRLKIVAIRVLTIMMLAAALPIGQITALAGSAKISFSDPSPGVGEEFTVSVKINSADGTLGGADVMLSYDPNAIQFISGSNASGGAGSVHLVGMMNSDTNNSFSFNLKFKALQAGDSKINVSDSEIYDVNTQPVTVSKTGASTVKVKAPSTYSKEASLASLKVSPGKLDPAFSPSVISYKVSVGSDVTKLAVSATPKDSKAKVVVSDVKLKVGENKIVCKVTAEDGQTVRSYTLKVDRAEPSETTEESSAGTQEAVLSEQKVTVDQADYMVASSFDASLLPEGFTKSTCSYNGSEVMCGTGKGLTLIYLQNSEGAGGFYIYEPDTGALSSLEMIHQPNSSIIVLSPDDTVQIPDGFVKTSAVLGDGKEITAWVGRPADASAEAESTAAESQESASSSTQSGESAESAESAETEAQTPPDYYLVYGMNDQGVKGFYRYDTKEQTFQRYIADPVKSSYNDADVKNLNDRYNSLLKDYNIRFFVMVGLVVLCLILFFIIINMLLKHRDHKNGGPGGGWRDESETPVKRRLRQEELRERQSSGRTNRREDDFYKEPGSGSLRPETLRLYREEPARGTAAASERGERGFRQERMPRPGERPKQPSDRSARRETERSGRQDRYDRSGRPERTERPEHPNRYDRPDASGQKGRFERPGSSDRQERFGRPETSDRQERFGRPEASDRQERFGRPEASDRQERFGRPEASERQERFGRPETSDRQERFDRPNRSGRPDREMRPESDQQRHYRDYDFSQEAGIEGGRRPQAQRSQRNRQDAGMEEIMRQREIEREERSRQARERLERERREDERRAGGERPGGRSEQRRGPQSDQPPNRRS